MKTNHTYHNSNKITLDQSVCVLRLKVIVSSVVMSFTVLRSDLIVLNVISFCFYCSFIDFMSADVGIFIQIPLELKLLFYLLFKQPK